MEILHLYTPKRGVRFYAKVKNILYKNLHSDLYKVFETKECFFNKLNNNINEYDIVLITAHGAEDSIIIPRRQHEILNHSTQYKRYISLEDTVKFINDFVFSVACSTALEFGPKTIENGAKSFLGYELIIENLFQVSDLQITRKIRKVYENIAKQIFVEELANSILKFIDDFQTVNMLKQSFAFNLEKRLINLFKMNVSEIDENYGYKIDAIIWKKNRPKLSILQLDFLREVNSHLVCLGDPEYISIIGFNRNNNIPPNIIARLEKANFNDQELSKLFKIKLAACKTA